MSEPVHFVDELPPQARPRPKWADLLAPLMEQPGRWAIVRQYRQQNQASAAANNLTMGKTRVYLPGRFEFAARRTESGGGDLYARWLGDDAT